MTIKKLVGYLHLWLGLASGLIVLVVALTGALYVFQDELETRLIHPERNVVKAQNRPLAPVAGWLHTANTAFAKYDSVGSNRTIYWWRAMPGRATVVGTSYRAGGETHYLEAFLHPYTGQLIEVAEPYGTYSFWRIVIDLHMNLLLGKVGSQLVRYGTLVFLLMLISGIVLWWPKNKPALKQRYKFRWKDTTKWKRKNYDLHNVLGFYASWVVVFMAITGLVWSFGWFSKGLYFALSGGETRTELPAAKSPQPSTDAQIGPLFARFQREQPAADRQARSIYLSYPSDTAGYFQVVTEYDPAGLVETDNHSFYYERATGKLARQGLGWEGLPRQNAGDWVSDFNGQIHYGSLFGLPSKVLVFFACLIVASLPVTGFLVWWGRRKKDKRASRHLPATVRHAGKHLAQPSDLPKVSP